MAIKHERGDFNMDRLFCCLQKHINITSLTFVKQNVILVNTDDGFKIVKGYKLLRELMVQYHFISLLSGSGFDYTPVMKLPTNEFIFENGLYWGVFPFIEKTGDFTFTSIQDCGHGLQLLSHLHHSSVELVSLFQHYIPYYEIKQKWTARYQLFLQNAHLFEYYAGSQSVQSIQTTVDFSLSHLPLFYDENENQKDVIIHSDVAHHNFIRSHDNCLYLIDFDLIKIAPKSIDVIQYTNRILSRLNWSYEALCKMDELRSYIEKEWFLACVIYPQDLFREWFKMVRAKSIHENSVANIIATIKRRKPFVEKIISMIR